MEIHVVTIFPRMVEALVSEGILARSIARGLLRVVAHDLRDYTTDRHRVVDDVPFGGGPGMVMKPEPVVRAVEGIAGRFGTPSTVVLPSPQGRRFTHDEARRLAGLERVVVLCGRYEGIDDRVRTLAAAEELSIGDYVLSGGELAALVMLDATARLLPGAVGDEQSVEEDSFVRGVLDYPHFTRPAEFRGLAVPQVLLSGHHAEIRRWRRREALRRTLERRPDLLAGARLDEEQQDLLRELTEDATEPSSKEPRQ
jgi:tRNA (guanine37-N1)-methyltransferase